MKEKQLLNIICIYLLGVPIITSLNGLSMHLAGASSVGPLYHTFFSMLIIGMGLLSGAVQKNRVAILGAIGLFTSLVMLQLVRGISDLAVWDLGQLYKWFMPMLLFVTFFRWQYLSEPEAQEQLAGVFRNVPLIYSLLIFVSFVSYLLFSFNPTVFEEGAEVRFIGFAWGYNTTVNAFFICAYVNFLLRQTAFWRKVTFALAFLLLLSKSAVAYFGLFGFSLIQPHIKKASIMTRVLVIILAAPILALVIWFGLSQSMRSADFYARQGTTSLEQFSQAITAGRLDWWLYMLDDVPSWPLENIVLGNGTNVDRRLESSLWQNTIGRRYYNGLRVDKSTKTLELDMLSHLDLFGVLGVLPFALVFYVYPFLKIKLPYFKLYSLFLMGLSLFGGHVLSDPQTSSLLVFLFLFLRYHEKTPPLPAQIKSESFRLTRSPSGPYEPSTIGANVFS